MKRVAIVGAGIVGTTLAWHLVKAGHRVDLFETGPDIPYPHAPQFANEVLFANQFARPAQAIPAALPADVRGLVQTGDYAWRIDDERSMCVGGQATRWWGITPRLVPETFAGWPITYDDLEPWYGEAERYLGISGSADDNPFAAPRKQPYPLPPFELGAVDLELAARLKAQGLHVHTTAQARTRRAYDGRPACSNYGTCGTCPTGARYSPNHHLAQALRTGLATLHTRSLVRRIVMEGNRARALLVHPGLGAASREHAADAIIVAAGGIESARLLLLSKAGGPHREGLGNDSGQVGRNLVFHHVWRGQVEFSERMLPGRAGPPTMLSHQFVRPAAPREHGGMTVELFDTFSSAALDAVMRKPWRDGAQVVEAMRPGTRLRTLTFNAEARRGPGKYAALAKQSADRFGDPYMHVHYELDDFDRATYKAATGIGARFAQAMGAVAGRLDDIASYWSAHHHLGTCRMGADAREGVVDSFGTVHGAQGVYVCGGSTFASAGALQPTLTMVALAIRSARRIADTLRG
ncbi:GMC family oxidoreductase [Ramlibacter sp. PS4R-6]|uniref:GMC family oxidoreductase n=1 Tax=Ramlibacter sp. PS4R-6 TaxID=3133438 RepID=UPI0030A7AD93